MIYMFKTGIDDILNLSNNTLANGLRCEDALIAYGNLRRGQGMKGKFLMTKIFMQNNFELYCLICFVKKLTF